MFVRCVPPHSSLLNAPIDTIRTGSGYFSPNSIIAPCLRASASGSVSHLTGSAACNALRHIRVDRRQLLARHRAEVRKVEPQPILVHLRALLLRVRAQVLLQRVVQDVRRRMGPPNAGPPLVSTTAFTLAPSRITPLQQMPLVNHEPAVFLRIGDDELKPVADELARVADLAAALAVERRAIEHHAHRVLVPDFFHLVAQVIVRRLCPR